MNQKSYTIDAAGKTIGRVASEAAKALMGKTSASYTPHLDAGIHVSITNASKLHILEKKRKNRVFKTYSGYPGGMRTESLASLLARRGPGAALERAIERMLPRNATRTLRMKRLQITS